MSTFLKKISNDCKKIQENIASDNANWGDKMFYFRENTHNSSSPQCMKRSQVKRNPVKRSKNLKVSQEFKKES